MAQEPEAAAIQAWLLAEGHAVAAIAALPGDVSPRRYFRVTLDGGDTAVCALYPEAVRATGPRFAATSELLEKAGVRVPRILASALDRGHMLLEDLGEQTLFDRAAQPWTQLQPWYLEALEVLRRIRVLDSSAVAALNPTLDAPALRRELEQTWELFLAPRRLVGDARRAAALGAALDSLCQRLADEPPVPSHRDFMARNLIALEAENRLAVIDHQDLRLAPPGYDLASLLNDSLFPPAWFESSLLDTAADFGVSRESYHRAAAQRTLKAVGTFVAFARRGSERHLVLVPPTLRQALRHLARLPESAAALAPLRAAWEEVAAG